MRIQHLFNSGAIVIQNGFPCGNWNDDGEGIPQLRPFNVTEGGRIDLSTLKYIETDKKLDSYLLRPNDVIFNNTNSEELVGKTALWTAPTRAVLSNHMTIVRVLDDNAANAAFLALYLLYRWYEGHFKMVCRRHVNQASVSREQLCDVAFPDFDAAEQRQIARVLSAVQRAIERQERLISLTAELKNALMHKLFTKGTRGEKLKQTEIGPVPESWEVVRLDHIATIERGKFAHRPRNAPQFYGGTIPFVQTGDVSQCDGRIRKYTQTLNERGLAISRMFPRGTILITIAANIGFAGILEFDSACTDSLVAIRPTRGDSAEYLNHYLQTQQPVMDRMAPQGTQKNINIQFLKPWPIPRATKGEQAAIADALNKVDSKRRMHEQTRDSHRSLFRTLLHQLMTGQVRVHDLDLSALDAEQNSSNAIPELA